MSKKFFCRFGYLFCRKYTGLTSLNTKDNTIFSQYINRYDNYQALSSSVLSFRGKSTMALSPSDPSSFSLPDVAITKHVSIKLNVDFDTKVLSGDALMTFDVKKDADQIILDAKDLDIANIQLSDGRELKYTVDSTVENFGSKLTIKLPSTVEAGQNIKLKIQYKTSPTASALQWLSPAQTSGKQYPYLFSQCQPIHARSILPCQDSPAVKFTYDAQISAPEVFTVLMSAIRGDKKDNVTYFDQPVPIPSYLLAIAVGVLESRVLGKRSHVWSEKAEIESSAWEFSETEKYLSAAEKLAGPYVWTQYDLLVLPPSFPYGGMENPCLTFVTPTLLAGDKSLADVIVHEIMHSWSGNLVTNRNFEHFWLNEGFTVFLERKVDASLIENATESKKHRDFSSLLGLQTLHETVSELGESSPLTNLVVNLQNVHPDDSFSSIPYEKGSLFLRYLEDLVGGPEIFDDFLRSYLDKFKYQSIDTQQFKDYLLNYFKGSGKLDNVDWDTWLHKPGMPPVIPDYDTSLTKAVNDLIATIKDINTEQWKQKAANFTPSQTIHFLQKIIEGTPLNLDQLNELDITFKLNSSKNVELLYRWYRMCLKSHDDSKLSDIFAFLNRVGRMKYARPLYRDLYAWEAVRQQAIDNFLKNESNMMHVSAYTLRKDLHLVDKDA